MKVVALLFIICCLCLYMLVIFYCCTDPALMLIQSTIRNVRLSVCLCVRAITENQCPVGLETSG